MDAKTMGMIVRNRQGAVKGYTGIKTIKDANRLLNDEWIDPQNLCAELIDSETGDVVAVKHYGRKRIKR